MRLLWTFVKVIVGLAIIIPLSLIILATALGIFGALVGLAFLVLRLAIVGLVVFGAFKLLAALFGGSRKDAPVEPVKALPPVDPYYEAAKRELDRELGHAS